MMDYDTMKAGPELDKLIAEKVMGWQHKTKPFSDRSPIRDYWVNSDNVPVYDGMPRFSTTWDGMGMMVDALQERGWHLTLAHDDYTDKWSAMFWKRTGEQPFVPTAHGVVGHEAAPLAAAIAALKAVEAGKDVSKDGGDVDNTRQ